MRCLLRRLVVLGMFVGGMTACVAGEPFPETQPLTETKPLDHVMLEGMERYLERNTAAAREQRLQAWTKGLGEKSKAKEFQQGERKKLAEVLGVVDARSGVRGIEYVSSTSLPSVILKNESGEIRRVRWQVLEGVTAEGLLLQPKEAPLARVVAIPDADWTPEMFCGLSKGVPFSAQLPRRLWEAGCQVLVPTLISRADTYSGNPEFRMTNQPHREFIHRQAFEMGRTLIGYEVQKVLAAVDQFTWMNEAEKKTLPCAVAGVSEGGLIALNAGALDPRISSVYVAGYFQPREGLVDEPIYRNVWRSLRQAGDAELAALIAPRSLFVEACGVPEIAGPPAVKSGRAGGAAPGKIETCTLALVRKEVDRGKGYFQLLGAEGKLQYASSGEGDGPAGSEPLWGDFVKGCGGKPAAAPKGLLEPSQALPDPDMRQKRQFTELVEYTQKIFRHSHKDRDKLWGKASRKSVAEWDKTADEFRALVWNEMIGRLPSAEQSPFNVRTRQVLDEPGYRGYEVLMDVEPDIVATGILLWPKDLKPGEKRPVVVCQHGLEGVPMDTITRTGEGFKYYSAFTHELANRGFITYAPQNPYRGQTRFRQIQRASNPLGLSLYSFIIPQHQKTVAWLASLSEVDPSRIAFYGLSYGGKTAVRVPTMLKEYCLSICSGDFNEWVLKNVSVDAPLSYVFTPEYEIFEWNMGFLANYAELAYLMTPRPFMVERGHHDGVSYDEWVAWEYAKVRRHYAELGIPEKTEIEFFLGPHKINGVQTYEFLHRHLNWGKE